MAEEYPRLTPFGQALQKMAAERGMSLTEFVEATVDRMMPDTERSREEVMRDIERNLYVDPPPRD